MELTCCKLIIAEMTMPCLCNYLENFIRDLILALFALENMGQCPQQPGSYECGYYVMKWMYDITLHYASSEDDIEKCVSGTEMNTELMNEVRE
ncbi:hypothetical protein KSS87_004789, partial [Heliosperma pusillum]